jgi:hypothetical protein
MIIRQRWSSVADTPPFASVEWSMDGWVAGWSTSGRGDESDVYQDWEDAAEVVNDLLHQERFGAIDLDELDAYERAAEQMGRLPDAEPFEIKVSDQHFYVRGITQQIPPQSLDQSNEKEGWSR